MKSSRALKLTRENIVYVSSYYRTEITRYASFLYVAYSDEVMSLQLNFKGELVLANIKYCTTSIFSFKLRCAFWKLIKILHNSLGRFIRGS
jgi:hypothetical protein